MDPGLLLILGIVAIIGVLFFRKHHLRTERARFLRRAGFGSMAAFSLFFGLFVAGETFSDPGGWETLGLVTAWAVPLAALAALTWYRPDWAIRIYAILITAVIGLSIWFAIDPAMWRAFEDRNGPIRTVIVFALSAAVALLGLKRTALAGVMLLVLGIVPVLVSSLGSDLGSASLLAASSPSVITGVLYIASARVAGGTVPSGGAEAGPGAAPQAA